MKEFNIAVHVSSDRNFKVYTRLYECIPRIANGEKAHKYRLCRHLQSYIRLVKNFA